MSDLVGKMLIDDTGRNSNFTIVEVKYEDSEVALVKAMSDDNVLETITIDMATKSCHIINDDYGYFFYFLQ